MDRGRHTSIQLWSGRRINLSSLLGLIEPMWSHPSISCMVLLIRGNPTAHQDPAPKPWEPSEAMEVSLPSHSPLASTPHKGMDGVQAVSLQSWLWPTKFLGHHFMSGAVLPPDPSWPWKVSSGVWQSCASANKPKWAWAGSVSLAGRICSLGRMKISCSFPLSTNLRRAGKPQPQFPNCSWMQQQCNHLPCPQGHHFSGHKLYN